jgi:hypothetical protein
MARAEGRFDVLITMDSGLARQRDLATPSIAVVVLRARSNRLADTRPLMPKVLSELKTIMPGKIATI